MQKHVSWIRDGESGLKSVDIEYVDGTDEVEKHGSIIITPDDSELSEGSYEEFCKATSPVINDDIREICKDYRYITQYGGWGFVYKFENDLKEDLSKNDKYSVTHDLEFEGEYYLPIIIEMDDGAVYKDEIVLFSEREEIYYVPYQDSKKIVEIRIDNDEIDGDFDNNIKITHL